jgi:hypothetical protein
MYKIKCEKPWSQTYDAKKDGFSLASLFLIPVLPTLISSHVRGLTLAMSIQWYGSFLRAGALIPQSFVFCDYIKNDELYDQDLFQWVVFKGFGNLT